MEPISTLTGYMTSRFLHGMRIILLTVAASIFITHATVAHSLKNKAPSTEDAAASCGGIPNVVTSQGMLSENKQKELAFENNNNDILLNQELQNNNTHQNNYTKSSVSNEPASHTHSYSKPGPGEEIELATAKLQAYHILLSVQQLTSASDSEMNLFQNYYYDQLFGTDVNYFWKKVEDKLIVSDNDIKNYADTKTKEYVLLFTQFREIEKDYPASITEYSSHNMHNPTATCNPACDNIDFENGTLSGWSAYYAQNTSNNSFTSTTPVGGVCGAITKAASDPNTNTYQVALMSGSGTDPVAGSLIPVVCPTGGSYSCRIGDSTRNGAQIGILQQTFTVTQANANFTYMYAVVLENPGHTYYQQPYFNVQMNDQNGNPIPNCGNYSVVSGPGLPGYTPIYYPSDGDTVYCKPWTTVFVPLQAYIGQCVTLTVKVSDCALGGHFGYAYFDASCLSGIINSLPILCSNISTLTASAPSGASSYKWIGPCIVGPNNQQSITVSCAGIYKVAITSIIGSGCADTIVDTVKGSVIPSVSVSQPGTNISCYGGSNGTATASASGGAGSFTYLWAPNGQTTATATNLGAGTYSVTVTDANGCKSNSTVSITQPSQLNVSGSNTPVKCNAGNTGSVSATATGGTPNYQYLWTPSNLTNSSATNLSAGTYTVKVTDANGCITSTQTTIIQPTALTSKTSSGNVSCNAGNNGFAFDTIAGGTPPYTYLWTPSSGVTPSANNMTAGSYTVKATDANGCIINTTIIISQPTLITSSGSSSGASCNGGVNGSASVIANGGTPTYSYAWAPYGGVGSVANGLSVGNYTVTITDANNCKATNVITVTQPPLLVAGTSSTNINCYGGSTGTATASANGGTGSYSYLWAPNGQTTATATNLSAGSYSVTVTDANGCKTNSTTSVTQASQLNVSGSSTAVKCNAGGNGSASALASGGTPIYKYLWTPSNQTNSTATNLSAGTYTVKVTDANGCITSTQTAIIQPTALTSKTSSGNVSCNAGNNGFAFDTIAGGTPPYTYLWTPSSGITPSANNMSAGTYTVKAIDANGCIINTTITISQPTPITSSASSSGASCNGGVNGSASIIANGGTPTYSYTWAPYGGIGSIANGLSAGNYTVTITDAHNCKAINTITVTQPTLVVATNLFANVSCNGGNNGTAKVTASGGVKPYSYAWLPNASTTDSATNLPIGVYAVVITDAHNCSTTQTINIVQPSLVTTVQGSGNNVSCYNGSNGSTSVSALGGTPPYSYQWLPKGGSSYTATNLTAGSYTVTVTDAHNCPATLITTISQPTQVIPSVASTNNVDCYGGSNGSASINAIGGTSPYTYNWVPKVSTTNSASSLIAGVYTVSVTDAHGCKAIITDTIKQPTALKGNVVSATNISCNAGNNGSININTVGGTPTYKYSWNPNVSTGISASNLTAGTYTITITDANGCTNTINTKLNQPSPINTTLSDKSPSCNGLQNGSASVNVSGGVPSYNYTWNTTPTQHGSAVNNIGAGTYAVLITDANGCTQRDTIKVTQPFALLATIVNPLDPKCFGDTNGAASVYVSGGTLPYKYSWNTTPQQTSYSVNNLGAGTYAVNVLDANGCPISTIITLTQPTPIITQATGPDSICSGTTVTIMASSYGGIGTYNYQWSNSSVTIATENVTPSTTTTYTVTATDNNGCKGLPTTVTINTWNLGPADVTVSPAQTVCYGDTITLYANVTNANSGSVNIQWSNGFTGSGPYKLTNPSDTLYTITVTNQCGATVTKNIPVKVNPLPKIHIPSQSSSACYGTAFTYYDSLPTNQGDSYQWNFGDNTTGNTNPITHSYNTSGTYTVTVVVISTQGCSNTASAPANVNIFPTAKAAFTTDPSEAPISNPVIACKNASANATTWAWDFGDKNTSSISYEFNPTHTYSDTGRYIIHLYTNNKYGCADTAKQEVRIDPEFTFYVPNAFSPNGDGVNEVFTGKGIGIIGFDMMIFDRWGMMLYQTNDINKGWDGTVNGGTNVSQEDTYVYKIAVTDYLGKVHKYLGSVTIIK